MKPDLWHDPLFLAALKKGGAGGTASGDIVTFNAPKAAPLKALTLSIDPIQDLHGYDAPWPGGGGVNLFNIDRTEGTPIPDDKPASTSPRVMDTMHYFVGVTRNNYYDKTRVSAFSINGTEISLSVDGGGYGIGFPVAVVAQETYTLSFTNTSNGKISIGYYDADWNYLSEKDGSLYQYTFTTPASCAYAVLVITVISTSSPASLKNIQLKLGSSVAPYAPYSNLCPISGWDEVNLWRTGKNLYNMANQTTSSGNTYLEVDVKPNTDYVFSVDLVQSALYAQKKDGDNWTTFYVRYMVTSIAFNTGDNSQIRLMTYNTAGNPTQFQLELGTTPSAYTPYSGNQFTIQLGQTVYGGTRDVTNGVLTVDRAYALLNDPDKWVAASSTTQDFEYTQLFNDRKLYSTSFQGLICSAFAVDISAAVYMRWTSSTSKKIGIKNNTSAYTLSDIQQMAQGNQIAIVYELATPLTYTLTAAQLDTLAGQNVVWGDSGSVSLEYAGGGVSTDMMLSAILHEARQ